MRFSIWQLPSAHEHCFMGTQFYSLDSVKLSDYVCVYSGYMEEASRENVLEKIFVMLNVDEERPADYFARSLSVSDVIFLDDNNEVRWFLVDSVGFKELKDNFSSTLFS